MVFLDAHEKSPEFTKIKTCCLCLRPPSLGSAHWAQRYCSETCPRALGLKTRTGTRCALLAQPNAPMDGSGGREPGSWDQTSGTGILSSASPGLPSAPSPRAPSPRLPAPALLVQTSPVFGPEGIIPHLPRSRTFRAGFSALVSLLSGTRWLRGLCLPVVVLPGAGAGSCCPLSALRPREHCRTEHLTTLQSQNIYIMGKRVNTHGICCLHPAGAVGLAGVEPRVRLSKGAEQ